MAITSLVQHIAEALVDHPTEVDVRELTRGDTLVIEVRVHPDDRGKVIGRQGQTARALRTVVGVLAARASHRVILTVVED